MPPPISSRRADLGDALNPFSELIESARLPSGRDDLDQPLVAHSQRERILVSMSRACAQKGYGPTTIADIVEPAGVSRATFYELFRDKEDCLRASMELSLADAMGRVAGIYSPDKPWAQMVVEGSEAFLDLLASRPAFARLALIEAPAAGGHSYEMYRAGKRVLQTLLDRARNDPVEEETIPGSAAAAALAGAELLVVGQILAGNTRRLRELLPDVVYIIIVPYLGQDEALRYSRAAEHSLRTGA
jgi:AcrR family transcriptional regulator